MIRGLFNSGDACPKSSSPRSQSVEPTPLSRRDFLTFQQGSLHADGTWRIVVDSHKCTDCNACTRACSQKALRRVEEDRHVLYGLNPASCNGCGDCEIVCAAKALEVQRGNRSEQAWIDVVRLTKQRCSCCGQVLAGLVDGVCAICGPLGMRQALRR